MGIESDSITAAIDEAIARIRSHRKGKAPSFDPGEQLWEILGALSFMGGWVGVSAPDVREKLEQLVDVVRGRA